MRYKYTHMYTHIGMCTYIQDVNSLHLQAVQNHEAWMFQGHGFRLCQYIMPCHIRGSEGALCGLFEQARGTRQ